MTSNDKICSMTSNDKIFNYRHYINLPKVPIFYNLLVELVAAVNFCIEMPCLATITLCPTYTNINPESNCISLLLGCFIVLPISFTISLSIIFILFSLIILIILINIIIWPFIYSYNFYTQTRVCVIKTLPVAIGTINTIDFNDSSIKESSIVVDISTMQITIGINPSINETSVVLGVPIEHV